MSFMYAQFTMSQSKIKKKIKIHKIDEMWGLGTPQDLENFNQKFIR